MSFQFSTIGIASDHAGLELKKEIFEFLSSLEKVQVIDYGLESQSDRSVDYPDYAACLGHAFSKNKVEAGILICGTGLGMAIAANKYQGIRAVTVSEEYSCRLSREHNDANVLCLGGRILSSQYAVELVKIWLKTSFLGNHHIARIEKISRLEK